MKFLSGIFLKGLFFLLPVVLSVYAAVWFFTTLEHVLNRMMLAIFPNMTLPPGLSLGIGIVLVFALGVLLTNSIFNRILRYLRETLRRVPLIRIVYSCVEDLLNYFNQDKKNSDNGHVVLVQFPNMGFKMVGLMTREGKSEGTPEFKGLVDDCVAVYFPMSYAWGGYTIFIPREWVTKLDMPVSDLMRSALIAWMKQKAQQVGADGKNLPPALKA